jgi:hypothetical protein
MRYTVRSSRTDDTLAEMTIRSCPRPGLLGERRRAERALDDRLEEDDLGLLRLRPLRVLVHELGEEPLVERAPVHADAHRLVVLDGDLDDLLEVRVAVLGADVARVDTELREGVGGIGVLLEQQMAVVVEVADDGRR